MMETPQAETLATITVLVTGAVATVRRCVNIQGLWVLVLVFGLALAVSMALVLPTQGWRGLGTAVVAAIMSSIASFGGVNLADRVADRSAAGGDSGPK